MIKQHLEKGVAHLRGLRELLRSQQVNRQNARYCTLNKSMGCDTSAHKNRALRKEAL